MLGLLVFSLHALANPVAVARDNPFLPARGAAGLLGLQTDEQEAPALALRPTFFRGPWKGFAFPPSGSAPRMLRSHVPPGTECALKIMPANPAVDAEMVKPMAEAVDPKMIRRSRCVP